MCRTDHNLAAQTSTRFTVQSLDRHSITYIKCGSGARVRCSAGNTFNLGDNTWIVIGDGHRGASRRVGFLEHDAVDAVGKSVQQIDLEDGILARAGRSTIQQEPVGGVGHRVIPVLARVGPLVAAQITDCFQT